MYNRLLLTAPASEPVTLAEAKSHAVLEHSLWDTDITAFIVAARTALENRLGVPIVRQKWRLYFDNFADLRLLANTKEVEAVKYIDSDGNEQTVTSSVYTVNLVREQIYLAYNQTWPTHRAIPDAVYVDLWAGYYDATSSPIDETADVPEPIKLAIKFTTADYIEYRTEQLEMQPFENKSYERLISSYRRVRI